MANEQDDPYGGVIRPRDSHERYWVRVIAMRSYELTPVEKLLIVKMTELDQPKGKRPGGCFASIDALAEMIGTSVRTVKSARGRLRRFGLLYVDPTKRWFVIMPATVSLQPENLKGDAMNTWLARQANALSNAIRPSAHGERAKRRNARVQHHARSSAESRPAGGNITPSEVQHHALPSAKSRPARDAKSGPKRRRGKRSQSQDESLVGYGSSLPVSHEVTNGVSHFRNLAVSGAPSGRAGVGLEQQQGIPGDGGMPTSDEPGEIEGWFGFRKALIAANGGTPSWFKDGAERDAYIAKRRRGHSHHDLLRFAYDGLVGAPGELAI